MQSNDAPHVIARCECRICKYRHVSVHPENVEDETALECPACGEMTAEVVATVIDVECVACGRKPDGVYDNDDLRETPCPICERIGVLRRNFD